MKHTKGPWTYEYDTCKSCEESGTKEFTIVGPPGAYHGQFSNEDDARLIAAAPSMYLVLERYAEQGDTQCIELLEAINGYTKGHDPVERG